MMKCKVKEFQENMLEWLIEHSENGSCIQDMEDVQVMGSIADMIKDMSEVIYYKTVVDAMDAGAEVRPVQTDVFRDMPEEYDPRYGKAYSEYRSARKRFMETKAEHDKQEMEKHADKHLKDWMHSLKEMYKEVSATKKAEMRSALNELLVEMSTT